MGTTFEQKAQTVAKRQRRKEARLEVLNEMLADAEERQSIADVSYLTVEVVVWTRVIQWVQARIDAERER